VIINALLQFNYMSSKSYWMFFGTPLLLKLQVQFRKRSQISCSSLYQWQQ